MDKEGRYNKLLKVLGLEGLGYVDENGVHIPQPVMHLGCVCAATFAAFRGGNHNPNMKDVLEKVGSQFDMSGFALHKEIVQELRECNCWLPVSCVVWYLIGRCDMLNENRIYFAKRGRSDLSSTDAGK